MTHVQVASSSPRHWVVRTVCQDRDESEHITGHYPEMCSPVGVRARACGSQCTADPGTVECSGAGGGDGAEERGGRW
jgi:hypothetical protein